MRTATKKIHELLNGLVNTSFGQSDIADDIFTGEKNKVCAYIGACSKEMDQELKQQIINQKELIEAVDMPLDLNQRDLKMWLDDEDFAKLYKNGKFIKAYSEAHFKKFGEEFYCD